VGINAAVPAFELHIPPLPAAPGDARRALAAWLVGRGISICAAEPPVLVVSELVSNGVVHGDGHDIDVSADLDGPKLLRIEVATHERPLGAPAAASDVDATGGRGLGIVTSCCDEVRIRRTAGGRRVTCTMHLTD
jgi:anti-sigma regulatory factor (Ser/Thr protein kinase)